MWAAAHRILIEPDHGDPDTFDQACRAPGLAPTRTHSRHAGIHDVVERLHGTILAELWCFELCRRFFTRAALM